MKNYKIIFSLLLAFVMTISINAQDKKNCYVDYVTMFKERSAKPVTDGVQNVVVTVRTNDGLSCESMVGTIVVKGGQIAGRLMLKTKAGEMVKPNDKLNEKYQAKKEPMKTDLNINNGMSASFLTQKNYVINLFFIDFLNPAMPAMAEAPKAK